MGKWFKAGDSLKGMEDYMFSRESGAEAYRVYQTGKLPPSFAEMDCAVAVLVSRKQRKSEIKSDMRCDK